MSDLNAICKGETKMHKFFSSVFEDNVKFCQECGVMQFEGVILI